MNLGAGMVKELMFRIGVQKFVGLNPVERTMSFHQMSLSWALNRLKVILRGHYL